MFGHCTHIQHEHKYLAKQRAKREREKERGGGEKWDGGGKENGKLARKTLNLSMCVLNKRRTDGRLTNQMYVTTKTMRRV